MKQTYKTKLPLSKISEELTLGIICGSCDSRFTYYDRQAFIRFLREFNEGEKTLLDELYLCGKTHPLFYWLGKFEIETISDKEEYEQLSNLVTKEEVSDEMLMEYLDSVNPTTQKEVIGDAQDMIVHFQPIIWN